MKMSTSCCLLSSWKLPLVLTAYPVSDTCYSIHLTRLLSSLLSYSTSFYHWAQSQMSGNCPMSLQFTRLVIPVMSTIITQFHYSHWFCRQTSIPSQTGCHLLASSSILLRQDFSSCQKHLYKVTVSPILNYCCCIWDPTYATYINQLESVQRFMHS